MATGIGRILRRLGIEQKPVGGVAIGGGGGKIRSPGNAERLDHREARGPAQPRRLLRRLPTMQLQTVRPQGLRKLGHAPLKPGMILSNEPGYYKTGAYGIRIENLVLVIAAASPDGGEKPLNAFETLSFAPIDRRLVDPRLLTSQELHWLNNYHARVREAIMPLIDPATQSWLERATRAI